MTFDREYKKLNPAQKKAVDQIEGPLLVIAGPGTGKTQLLSTRVANILKQTDTPAGSILCLTFTDSAARTMRERLISIIGEDAYHVAIHTFHSFGLEVMGQYPQYFSQYANFAAIDDVTRHQIISQILSKFPKSSPLAARDTNNELVWVGALKTAVSDLKRAAITPQTLEIILAENKRFLDFANPLLNDAFTGRWQGSTPQKIAGKLSALLPKLASFKPQPLPAETPSLRDVLVHELKQVLSSDLSDIKSWRDKHMVGTDGNRRLKEDQQLEKLIDLVKFYKKYQTELNKHRLHDYDDMILRVLETLGNEPDLKAELQERYLYVLVDEFQDTSSAQYQLLKSLLDNPVHEGRPNVMVVGDDDQAIFRFQGAQISNMLNFRDSYRDTTTICLTQNYRSTQNILDTSRFIVEFGQNRLEEMVDDVDKHLQADKSGQGIIKVVNLPDSNSERHWVGKEIHKLIDNGVKPEEIAVIGRYHEDLIDLLPHLDMPVRYKQRENVLLEKHIHELITMARAVVALKDNDHNQLKGLLSEIVGYEFWRLDIKSLWQFAVSAKRQYNKHWFELMLESDNKQLQMIATMLGELSRREPTHTAEMMFDWLIGNSSIAPSDKDDELVSPFKSYYFSSGNFETERARYIDMLSGLSALRQAFRQWRTDERYRLSDFVDFIDAAEQAKIRISDTAPHREDEHAVEVMTAHEAKGQEFEAVFVIDAVGEVWDKARRGGSSLSWPMNLPISLSGDEEDDRTRLFYVALTRAKHQLFISAPDVLSGNGKQATRLRFLSPRDDKLPSMLEPEHQELRAPEILAERLSSELTTRHKQAVSDNKAILKELIDDYQLSPTDLNAFVDVTRGGPQSFLLNNLLRFPSAKSASQAFGTAIHSALAYAYTTGQVSAEKLIKKFDLALSQEDLSELERKRESEHGHKVLEALVKSPDFDFKDESKVEYPFAREGVVVGQARLTGRIDKLSLSSGKWSSNGTVTVTDWKTGRPRKSWALSDIGIYKGRQQLYFYKLLIENSRSFKGKVKVSKGELIYVDGPHREQPLRLELTYDETELNRLQDLIAAVWQKIVNLDFPDTSDYPADHNGIKQFEKDLINKRI